MARLLGLGVALLPLAGVLARGGDEARLLPRWSIGHELVYRGNVQESSHGQGVQFAKTYQLEARCFVLDIPRPGVAHVACLTKLTLAASAADKPPAISCRLDVGQIDAWGRFTPERQRRPFGDFEGPDSFEDGYLPQWPADADLAADQWTLETPGPGEPAARLRRLEPENQGGTTCIKIGRWQEAPEWEKPRGDRPAWRQESLLWIHPRTGVVQRVQRTLLGRPAAHRQPSYRLVTCYELESSLRHEGAFHEDRRREIEQFQYFQSQFRTLSQPGARTVPVGFAALGERIDLFLKKETATPYREAIVQLRDLARAGQARQLPTPVLEEPGSALPMAKAGVGQLAPDFAIRRFGTEETLTPKSWRGKPALLIFFHPGSASTPLVLRASQSWWEDPALAGKVYFLALAMSEDEAAIDRCQRQFNLTVPLAMGTSLRVGYEVSATPCLMLLDATGHVAGRWEGWGPESARQVRGELLRVLPRQP